MRARRVRTVGLRALQLCALFLAGACGASFFKSAHLSEKHLPGQSASTLFEDGQLDISSKVVAGASLGTHHRELQRAAQKVSLRASNTSRATLDALHRALIRGQAGMLSRFLLVYLQPALNKSCTKNIAIEGIFVQSHFRRFERVRATSGTIHNIDDVCAVLEVLRPSVS